MALARGPSDVPRSVCRGEDAHLRKDGAPSLQVGADLLAAPALFAFAP